MSTLVEELEDAALLAEAAGRKTGTLDSVTEGNHFARRLRQRAAWVRELVAMDLRHRKAPHPARLSACSPAPSPLLRPPRQRGKSHASNRSDVRSVARGPRHLRAGNDKARPAMWRPR